MGESVLSAVVGQALRPGGSGRPEGLPYDGTQTVVGQVLRPGGSCRPEGLPYDGTQTVVGQVLRPADPADLKVCLTYEAQSEV